MPDSPSDTDLVLAALRGGDESQVAQDEIIHRHHEAIYGFLMKLTGRREDAEDLTQDTFLQALRKLKTFKPGNNLRPWLFTIARRLTISQWRKSRPTYSLLDSDHPTAESNQPHDAVALWEFARRSLKRDEFMALWLHYQEAMPVKDVARVLKKTNTHAKVILHRARKQLGKKLSNTSDNWLPGHTPNLTI